MKLLSLGIYLAFAGCARASMTVFLLLTPDHRCAIPGLQNDTFRIQDESHQLLVNLTIPSGSDGNCYTYAANYKNNNNTKKVSNDEVLTKCDTWVYDDSVMTTTMVNEFGLVCDDALKIPHANMVYFAGVLVGAAGAGTLGDILGRKLSAVIAENVSVIALLITPWIQSFPLFLAMRFLSGAGGSGSYVNMFGITLEFMSKSKRVQGATLMVLAWPVGCIVTAVVAYFIRDWRYIHIAMNFPVIPLLAYYWLLPESIRWLVDKGKLTEANSLLVQMAKANKVDISNITLSVTGDKKQEKESILNIFTEPKLIVRFLVLGVNWMATSMVYYGLTLNVGSIGGNVFVNYALSNIVEIPGYCIVLMFAERIGRKKLHISLMLITGVACILTMVPVLKDREGLQTLTTALSMVGKMTISGAFQMVYIYTPELFPTALRISTLGACSCLARVGSMAAPYIAEISKYVDGNFGVTLPLVIFGAFTISTGLLCIVLPETRGVDLPSSIEAAKIMGSKQSQNTSKTKDVELESMAVNESRQMRETPLTTSDDIIS